MLIVGEIDTERSGWLSVECECSCNVLLEVSEGAVRIGPISLESEAKAVKGIFVASTDSDSYSFKADAPAEVPIS